MKPASLQPIGMLLRRRDGAVTMEFGLLLPALALIGLAMTDVVNLFRAHLRVESAALQLGQLVTQCNVISSPGDTDQFWTYAQRIVGNLGMVTGANAAGAVVVSAVGRVDNANRVAWQRRTGSTLHQSLIGTEGGGAALPGGFQVPAGQTLFVTEVFLPRQDWVVAAALVEHNASRVLRGSTMLLTRAPDAPSLLLPPLGSANPNCTG